jgi:uncharacterized protein (DUF427 family)
MARAMWQGQILATSDAVEIVEGNIYFPPGAIERRFFQESATTTVCGWKGTAHYFTVKVDGAENPDAAWYYPDPKPAAAQIKDYVAFWHGVTVER